MRILEFLSHLNSKIRHLLHSIRISELELTEVLGNSHFISLALYRKSVRLLQF